MKCDCIRSIEKRLLEDENILDAEVLTAGIIFGKTTELITHTEFGVTVKGKKKQQIKNVLHSFCPFCGTKIKD